MNATTVHVSLATAPSRNEAEHLPGTQRVGWLGVGDRCSVLLTTHKSDSECEPCRYG
jgi:hypothetical protein